MYTDFSYKLVAMTVIRIHKLIFQSQKPKQRLDLELLWKKNFHTWTSFCSIVAIKLNATLKLNPLKISKHISSSTQEISQITEECEAKFVEALKKYKANKKRVIKQEGLENISLSLNFEESQKLQESQDLLFSWSFTKSAGVHFY